MQTIALVALGVSLEKEEEGKEEGKRRIGTARTTSIEFGGFLVIRVRSPLEHKYF